jgi:hypothetical protein
VKANLPDILIDRIAVLFSSLILAGNNEIQYTHPVVILCRLQQACCFSTCSPADRSYYINVKDCGAVGNGISDDTQALGITIIPFFYFCQ